MSDLSTCARWPVCRWSPPRSAGIPVIHIQHDDGPPPPITAAVKSAAKNPSSNGGSDRGGSKASKH